MSLHGTHHLSKFDQDEKECHPSSTTLSSVEKNVLWNPGMFHYATDVLSRFLNLVISPLSDYSWIAQMSLLCLTSWTSSSLLRWLSRDTKNCTTRSHNTLTNSQYFAQPRRDSGDPESCRYFSYTWVRLKLKTMTLLMISIVPLYFYLIPLLLFCLFRSKPAKEVILSGYVRMVFSDSRAYSNTISHLKYAI